MIKRKTPLYSDNKERLFEEIVKEIDMLVSRVKPTKRLLLCVDGIAGAAKMSQQRQRRYKNTPSSSDEDRFHSSFISPGTEFMTDLNEYIGEYIVFKKSDPDSLWRDLDIVFSDHLCVGEGEQKIVSYIRENSREQKSGGGADSSYWSDRAIGISDESWCIHGLDADLIMLSLLLEVKQIYILRDDVYSPGWCFMVDITALGVGISEKILWEPTVDDKFHRYSTRSAINDFVFVCFIVGNDFLPQIHCIEILEGGIDLMVSILNQICSRYGHLTTGKKTGGSTFRKKALAAFFRAVGTMEKDLVNHKASCMDKFYEDKIITGNTSKTVNTNGETIIVVDMDSYTKEYHITKLGAGGVKELREVCHEYLMGMEWVLMYYTNGIPSWTWSYGRHYSPLCSDLCKYMLSYSKTDFGSTEPVPPFLQLLTILPPQSAFLLPSPLREFLGSPPPELEYLFPTEVDVDLSGVRSEWEGKILLPRIDLETIRRVYDQIAPQISTKELRRNIRKEPTMYISSPEYHHDGSYYDIEDCDVQSKTLC
jgi:5'-3' exonuclease